MDELYGCDRARPLLAELASGAVAGHERASTLHHVAGCSSCRTELTELARVADNLLLLAPRVEPPAGFESAVVARLGQSGHGRDRPARVSGRWPAGARRLLAAAASLVVAAALGASAVWWHTAPDRVLAQQTRETLATGNGKRLRAISLTTDSGTVAGAVFLYQGDPSWLVVSVSTAPSDGPYDVVLVNRDGRSYPIGTCQVAGGSGTTAYRLTALVVNFGSVLMSGPGGVRLTAYA